MSPSHVDVDAFLSCLKVTHSSENFPKKQDHYELNMEVALFFCFPAEGIAVALRPGDYLLFNPLYYHNASQRTKAYENKEVLLTSFYVTSKELSGNDNNREVSENLIQECKIMDNELQTNYSENLTRAIKRQKRK
jgi:ectoine hydroxylase-related dioxygenase (phytanoyl-CoA dioxygenase family)